MAKLKSTEKFIDVVHRLRKECPWDRKQTHQSLTRYLIEEAYEVMEAIESKNDAALCEELGDLLLQIALHSEIGSERKKFDFEKVASMVSEKMIQRHPHVFGEKKKDVVLKDHLRNWTLQKKKEKPDKFLLEGIPSQMPSLQLAQRYGEIASSTGFDWEDETAVLEKIQEECEELAKAKSQKEIEEEMGDLFFAMAQFCRHLKIDAEASLRAANRKFKGRFHKMEMMAKKKKKHLSDFSTRELENFWEEAKA